MGPQALARDPAGVVQVALHARETLEAAGERYDTLVTLLPTCPLRSADDIRGAYALFTERGRPFVLSVSEFEHTPFAALGPTADRSEEHTSELQSLMRTSYAVFCLKKKQKAHTHDTHQN